VARAVDMRDAMSTLWSSIDDWSSEVGVCIQALDVPINSEHGAIDVLERLRALHSSMHNWLNAPYLGSLKER
jgi:hypothetical protein